MRRELLRLVFGGSEKIKSRGIASRWRYLVLDEHSVYRTGLCHFLRSELPHAELIEASNLPQALDHIRNSTIDLVLVGTGRSSLAALDSFKAAREASPATRFAVASTSETRADILATLAAGFHGFISKHQSDTEILAAVQHPGGKFTCRPRSPG